MNSLMKPFFPALVPGDIFDQVEKYFSELDTYDRSTGTFSIKSGFPKGDIFLDKEGNKVIELSLAGYKREQLSVEIGDDCLTVSATKCDDTEENRTYTRARRAFTQKFTNFGGRNFDLEKSDVVYEDGLLRITVPKKEQKALEIKQLKIK